MDSTFPKKLWIALTRPFVVTAYKLRNAKRDRKNLPYVWKTPGQMLSLDLSYYEAESEDFELNKSFVDDLIPARDAALSRTNKLTVFNLIVLATLAADFFRSG
ncbi:hypothetical protein [Rhizobium sp. Leaf386]|uniref:hypothetical protein n=1 Tax=Rhizobium sp. Leaf386 TaxID=1736359 RepID=UPI000715E2BD|nr:hypothetical protein [Rhizobium sp. Leaf386]KQT04147.1 hypothetical protein ASG50_18280 [Rhizobium sp. Leaf386]